MRSFTLSTPSLYPEFEYEGVYIAAGNTNTIFSYHSLGGLTTAVEPSDVPEGAEGIAEFCYADGDFFFRPGAAADGLSNEPPHIFQLTRHGHIRQYDLPYEPFQEVRDIGEMVYPGDGKLIMETRPRGPFATIDLVTGEVIRMPAQPPPLDTIQMMVADIGAEEIYIVRRAGDMSIYFLRYSFKGNYRGAAYVHRREFIASATSIGKKHLVQYASGEIDIYDFQYKRTGSIDAAKLVEPVYNLFSDFVIVGHMAFLIGQHGPLDKPESYDLIVLRVTGVK